MKQCNVCGEDIQNTARKCFHCQSYQNPADAPKLSYDTATLVISFVGVIAVLGTVLAGIVGWMGFRAIGDTKELNDKSQSLFERSQTEIKTFSNTIATLQISVNELTQKAASAQSELNGVSLRQQYNRFQELVEDIKLDYIYNYTSQLEEITKLASSASNLKPRPAESENMVIEMSALSSALDQYKYALSDNEETAFSNVIEICGPIPDSSVPKHRILAAAYNHLRDISLDAHNNDEAANYLNKAKYNAEFAFRHTHSIGKSYLASKNDYAAMMIATNDKQEMDRGFELLSQLRKDDPQAAIVAYNIAIYYVKNNRFGDAINCLEWAKILGDFSSQSDLLAWRRDKDFELLRNSDTEEYKSRLAKLVDLNSAPHSDAARCP